MPHSADSTLAENGFLCFRYSLFISLRQFRLLGEFQYRGLNEVTSIP
jgi:hypothetical protein